MRFSNVCAPEARRSERVRWRRRIGRLLLGALVGLLGLLSLPAALQASPEDSWKAPAAFEELLAVYDSMVGFESGFEEEKTLCLFREPLRSRGRIYFQPPSTLLRRIETPRPSEVLVTQDEVRIREDGRERVVDLRSRAEARPLVESILWLFAGDREALERVYSIEYEVGSGNGSDEESDSGGAQSWELRLRPRSAPLDRLIRELRVSGRGRRTEAFEFIETSGDRTRTRLIDPDPLRRFDAEERSRLFDSDPVAP
jgi:hypothetical protein